MKTFILALVMFAGLITGAKAGEVDRLYVIDCGWAHLNDRSTLSPSSNAPIDLSDNCYVVLSGDLAHIQSNWENKIVPPENYDKAASLASMAKIAMIVTEKHAQLWINHDKPSSDARRHAPQFYE